MAIFAFLIEASAETLLSVHHIVTMFVTSRYSYFIMMTTILLLVCFCRRNSNRQRADEQLDRLKDQLLLQQFLQECDEVGHRDGRRLFMTYRSFFTVSASGKMYKVEHSEYIKIVKIFKENILFLGISDI